VWWSRPARRQGARVPPPHAGTRWWSDTSIFHSSISDACMCVRYLIRKLWSAHRSAILHAWHWHVRWRHRCYSSPTGAASQPVAPSTLCTVPAQACTGRPVRNLIRFTSPLVYPEWNLNWTRCIKNINIKHARTMPPRCKFCATEILPASFFPPNASLRGR
jgi:hypothetical protein